MSSGLFTEVPPGAALLLAIVITIPCSLVVANMVTSYHHQAACDIAAAKWEAANQHGDASRANNTSHFAKQYIVFRTACPKGHMLVDDSKIPAAVRAGYVPEKN